jgi:tetratricopeptide (TPR) repeat protein
LFQIVLVPLLVLVLDFIAGFDYENEDDDEDEIANARTLDFGLRALDFNLYPMLETPKSSGSLAEFLRSSRNRAWLLGLLLVAATLLAYQPAWQAGFIWDDDEYVTDNPLLTAPDGLRRIWFSLDSPSQYFPLTYTVFRIERSLWGLDSAGYHWVNILLHAANALLVWRLLRRLSVPGAWLAAAIFALHPVQVESVAWVTELKNVLSLFFFLLAVLAWVEFVEDRPKPWWRFYGLALMSCALALFSKTTACTLPAALLLILWLKGKPITRYRLVQIVPFIGLGAGMGLVTVWWERFHQEVRENFLGLGLLDRLLVASHAVWFYAGKLIWPANLTFMYPHWTIHPADPLAYGWLLACAGACAAIYFTRRFFGRSVETAALFYVATLSPLLGFIMLYTFYYSFVADHYQYVACIGPIALAAAGMTAALGWLEKRNLFLKPAFVGTVLLLLGLLTWRQSLMYADAETLWRTTISRNPDAWMAYDNLGIILSRKGEVDGAMALFQKTLAIRPDDALARNNLGLVLCQKGRMDDGIIEFQKALSILPNNAVFRNNLGKAFLAKGRQREAMIQFQKVLENNPLNPKANYYVGIVLFQMGRVDEAMARFQKALESQPDFADAWDSLDHTAWLLATSPEASIRNGPKALALARQLARLSRGNNPVILDTLAAAYAETGQFSEAADAVQRALALALSQNKTVLADTLRHHIKLFQTGLPLRDVSQTNAAPDSTQP